MESYNQEVLPVNESDITPESPITSSTSEDVFLRPVVCLSKTSKNRRRALLESTDTEVPDTFQRDWNRLLTQRNGNIGVLDGFQFVMDTLMQEEGFRKLKVDEEEKETASIRRSYYSHLPAGSTLSSAYSCIIVFSGREKKLVIQSAVADEFRKKMAPSSTAPFVDFLSSRYWVSNAYGGSLRSSVVEMYRNLSELAILLKDKVVFKLKAIIAHGLDPPLLVGLDSLPLDVLERIMIQSSVQSTVNLAKTCTRVRSVFDLENVWRIMTRREFERYRDVIDEEVRQKHGSWKQAFIAEWKTRKSLLRVRNFGFHQAYPPALALPWYGLPSNVPQAAAYDPFDDDFF